MALPVSSVSSVVTATVYSVVWPATEALVRRCMALETDAMLERHRSAHTKAQDQLDRPFFEAWDRFASPAVRGLEAFPERYPCNGSSEAIREIIRQASWKGQMLVVFDGDYEGYEVLAEGQGTTVLRVDRARWRETLAEWESHGVPWGTGGAQWWVSQPSAIDGNVWPDFAEWLAGTDALVGCDVWVDLTYVGRARLQAPIDLAQRPAVAGVVFSLSKVMGAYYRRIGGCLSRVEIPGLWGNRWFKNLDSLFLGQRWLAQAGNALTEGQRYAHEQRRAMDRALQTLGGEAAWDAAGVRWQASDVPLLMYAVPAEKVPEGQEAIATMARRGRAQPVVWRLCLTPALEAILNGDPAHVA